MWSDVGGRTGAKLGEVFFGRTVRRWDGRTADGGRTEVFNLLKSRPHFSDSERLFLGGLELL